MAKLVISLAMLVLLAADATAGPRARRSYRAMIAAVFACESAKPALVPVTPAGDVCSNCKGTGKLGDGTVSVRCPVCDGTGKKKPTAPPAKPTPLTPPVQKTERSALDCGPGG